MPRNSHAVRSLDPRIQQQRQSQELAQPRGAARQRNAEPKDVAALLAQATVDRVAQLSSTAGSARPLPASSLLTVGIMSYLALSGPASALAAPMGGRRMLGDLTPAAAPQQCDSLYRHLSTVQWPATPSFVDCDGTKQPAIPTPQQAQARVNDSQPVYTYDSQPSTQLYGPHGPVITDVMEGQIGECVLSAMQSAYSLARPELVQQRVQQAWRHSVYNVTLTNPTTKKDESYYPNNAFPTLPDAALSYANNYPGRIVTYGPTNLVTWSMALEKAVALAAGPWHNKTSSYVDVIAGESLSMTDLSLTMFGDTMSVTNVGSYGLDNAALVQSMANASMVGLPTIAASKTADTTDGIVAEHAYTILGTTADGKILARNPWSAQNPSAVLERLYLLNTTTAGTTNVMDRGFMAITPETFRNNFVQIYRGTQGKTPGPMPSLVDTNFTLVHKGTSAAMLSNPMDFDYGWIGNTQDGPPSRG